MPKVAQKPNIDKNPHRDHESIFTISDNQEKDWYLYKYMWSIHGPKPKVCIPTQFSKVHGFWKVMRRIYMKLREVTGLLKQMMMIFGEEIRR